MVQISSLCWSQNLYRPMQENEKKKKQEDNGSLFQEMLDREVEKNAKSSTNECAEDKSTERENRQQM